MGRGWVVSVAMNRGGFCFGGGCWLVSSLVGVGYLGRVVGVGSVVDLWFSDGWCTNGGSGWFSGGQLHFVVFGWLHFVGFQLLACCVLRFAF